MSVLSKMMRIAGRDPLGNAKAVSVDENGNVKTTIVGSLPKLRRESNDPEPTVNDDGSVLVKYQTLWIMDTNVWKYWNGTSWVVMA